MATTRAVEFGFDVFGCASTGNLANSVAAHAARLGLHVLRLHPARSRAGKVLGSAIYGPHVVAVKGNYDDVNRLCTQIADKYGWGFANINLRSYYTEGAKTYGFEIAEQLGWRFPAATSCRRSRAARCCRASTRASGVEGVGLVDGDLPKIHAAQAAGCAPVVHALEAGLEFPEPVKPNTIAKSIAIGNPADGFQVLQVVQRHRRHRGDGRPTTRSSTAIKLLARDRRHLHRAGRRHHAGRRDRADQNGTIPATSRSSSASRATATRPPR